MTDVEKSDHPVGSNLSTDEPPWRSAFDDLTEAAALVLEESRHAEIRAEIYEEGAHSPALPHWQEWAAEAREHARVLNRAAALLDWMAGRADSLHLLRKPRPRERRP